MSLQFEALLGGKATGSDFFVSGGDSTGCDTLLDFVACCTVVNLVATHGLTERDHFDLHITVCVRQPGVRRHLEWNISTTKF